MSGQRQDSLHDQLKTVYKLATAAGCYDAADWIRKIVEDTSRRMEAAGIDDVTYCRGCNCVTKTVVRELKSQCGKCCAEKDI